MKKYVILNNGVKMPLVGYGTAGLNGLDAYEKIKDALSIGYQMIDTAHMYGNEVEIGKAIKDSGIDRKEIFVVSKVDGRSNSYEVCKKQIKKSLSDLDIEYIDLYLIHEPYSHAIEMWQAIEEAYEVGLIRAIGISNYFNQNYTQFMNKVTIKPMINQLETHIYLQREDFKKEMSKDHVQLMSWSPLTGGITNINDIEVLNKIANDHQKSVAQVILNYFVSRNIIVIPKSGNVDHMKDNLNIFDFDLTEKEINQIKLLDKNKTLFSWTESFI